MAGTTWVDDLISLHRAVFGDARMEGDNPDPDAKPDPDKPDPKPEDKPDPDDTLGDPGKRALDAIRKERDAAREEAKAARAKVSEFEDKDKTDLERATGAQKTAEDRASTAETKLLRLEVAMEKGLTPAQAKRLDGATREELEADADELLELFGGKKPDGDRKPLNRRPKERLRGGGDPDEEPEETDPAKLAASVKTRF